MSLAKYHQAVAANLISVRQRVSLAAQQAHRSADEITIVAVSKTHPAATVAAALAAGHADFGENRIQEAEEKIQQLRQQERTPHWHMIGHLQRNKARRALQLFDLIHSVDSVQLAIALDRILAEQGREDRQRFPILLQINVSGESTKEGFQLPNGLENRSAVHGFLTDVEQIMALAHIQVQGLMTIAPFVDDPTIIRNCFRLLRLLKDDLASRFPGDWRHLSMGMSHDFEIAIAEGATLVRLGTLIFGERQPREM